MIRELIDSELEVVAGGFTISGNGNDPVTINLNPTNNSPGGNATAQGNGNATGGNGGSQTFGPISF
jgi:hypothetical protein